MAGEIGNTVGSSRTIARAILWAVVILPQRGRAWNLLDATIDENA